MSSDQDVADRVDQLLGLSSEDLGREIPKVAEHEPEVIPELIERLDTSRRTGILADLLECLCGANRKFLALYPREVLAEAVAICAAGVEMSSFLKQLCGLCFVATRKSNMWGPELSAISSLRE